ncbi:MAG: hypothetical protein QNK04_17290 [Myxococcota bacterium]|nr:hypothetical protein [Myxococcota bacterium]
MQRFLREAPRRLLVVSALLGLSWGPSYAFAQDDEEEEDEEPSAFVLFLQERGNNAAIGLNGIITFPADPVMFAIEGPDVLDGWWAPPAHAVGFVAGLLQGTYRVVMGAIDIPFALIPKMPMLSPVPRFKALPFVLHDDE